MVVNMLYMLFSVIFFKSLCYNKSHQKEVRCMNEVYEKILNLNLDYQIEDSISYLDILYLELKMSKIQLSFLENEQPYWFQKKKLEKYKKKKLYLENRIKKYKKNIQEELELIAKMAE